MLTDDDLRELIESAAADAPPPSPLPDGLFHAEAPRTKHRSNRVAAPLATAAALVVVRQYLVVESALLSRAPEAQASSLSTVAGSIGPETPTTFAGRSGGAALFWSNRANRQHSGTPAEGAGGQAFPAPSAAAPTAPGAVPATPAAPADSARIIKNGSLEIRVGKGTVTESVNRLTALATGLGGYVSDTRTIASEQSGSQASATISVRVPSAAFEQLMSDASKLGEVRSTTTSGQDVTAQFTDIDAQLTALNATRDQFLLVLGEAKNVNDILAVKIASPRCKSRSISSKARSGCSPIRRRSER